MTLLGAHHIPKAIATSTGRTEASQSLGPLAARLEVIACGEEVPQGKAAPDVYLRADALLEVAPGRCLALEDSINGRRAASDAGMIVVMIPDLRDAPADETYLCESLNVSAAEIASALACGPGDNSSCDRNISQ
jgi:beta-phosphoglucomutase-like phosphatase (HAD superfamily)